MSILLTFVLGAFIGSFLGVIADRYQPDRWILANLIYGRSGCETCKRELGFFELIPLISFAVWGGRCRFCQAKLSWRYPVYEILSGLIVFSVAYVTMASGLVVSSLWIALFLILFLIALIDYRTTIIPNELSLAVAVIGLVLSLMMWQEFGLVNGSFIGHYAALFGFRESLLINKLMGIFVPAGLFLFLLLITKGRGMGFGDVKLNAALGVVFGWPDTLIIALLSFIVGSVIVTPSLFKGKKGRKDLVPFGPFIVMATFLIFFFGKEILSFYFSLFPIVV